MLIAKYRLFPPTFWTEQCTKSKSWNLEVINLHFWVLYSKVEILQGSCETKTQEKLGQISHFSTVLNSSHLKTTPSKISRASLIWFGNTLACSLRTIKNQPLNSVHVSTKVRVGSCYNEESENPVDHPRIAALTTIRPDTTGAIAKEDKLCVLPLERTIG